MENWQYIFRTEDNYGEVRAVWVFLNWGQAVDGDGKPLWKSSASPWQRVEATGRIHKMRPAKAKATVKEASERAGLT